MSQKKILAALHIKESDLLGKGFEGNVYAKGESEIIKIFNTPRNLDYLKSLAVFQKLITDSHLTFNTPQILDIHQIGGTFYTVERRIHGNTLDSVFPNLSEEQKHLALKNYFEAMCELNSVTLSHYPYGQVIQNDSAVQSNDWQDFLTRKLDQTLKKMTPHLSKDIENFDWKMKKLKELVKSLNSIGKQVVHGDYYPENVLVNEDLDISAVLDFGTHTVIGDPKMDAASKIFLKLFPYIKSDHLKYWDTLVEERYGKIKPEIDIYGLYYSVYYSDVYETDKITYRWSVDNLNDDSVWESLT